MANVQCLLLFAGNTRCYLCRREQMSEVEITLV